MRKIFVFIIGGFITFSAFGVGENVPTSKSYIDSVLVEKQDTIERATGNNQVLTNTGTAGEYGTKDIYDSTGSYTEQTDALVDAQTMNAAVQNAINAEFVCISWVDDDPTKDCLLMEIRGVTGKSILPSGYTALEYLDFTGSTSGPTETYIDTGITLSNTNTITVKVNAKNFWGVIGRYQGDLGFQLFNHYFRFGAFRAAVDINSYLNQTVVISYSQDGLYIDNNLIASPTTQSFRLRSPCLIGSIGSSDSNFKGKIYEATIKNNENIVGHFIPARRDSDSVLGMYDTVTNTFFTNAGTGEFIAGPVVNLYLPAGN